MRQQGKDILQEAYARVRSQYTDSAWLALPPRAVTDAIYRAMRDIDAERLRELSPATDRQDSNASGASGTASAAA